MNRPISWQQKQQQLNATQFQEIPLLTASYCFVRLFSFLLVYIFLFCARCCIGISFISFFFLCIRIVFLFKFLIVSVTKWFVFYSKFKSNARATTTNKKKHMLEYEQEYAHPKKVKKILNFYWHIFFSVCFFLVLLLSRLNQLLWFFFKRYSFRGGNAIVKLHASFICSSSSSSLFSLLLCLSAFDTSTQNSIFLISSFKSSIFIYNFFFDTCCHCQFGAQTFFDCLIILFVDGSSN